MSFKNLNGRFIPDTRGIGGRNDIINLHYNHLSSLVKAKPKINTFEPK